MKCAEYKVTMVRECELEYKTNCRTPAIVKEFWHNEIEKSSWYDPDKEMCVAILLSSRNHIKGYNLISMGSLSSSIVEPREVFRPAIISAAAAIILCHNHPSGDSTPSAEDIRLTKKLIAAGKIIDIQVLDHVIIGKTTPDNNGFTSMRESGLMEF